MVAIPIVLDPVIHIVCQSLFLLVCGDIALILHVLKDDFALFGVVLRMSDRVIVSRLLGNSGEYGGIPIKSDPILPY